MSPCRRRTGNVRTPDGAFRVSNRLRVTAVLCLVAAIAASPGHGAIPSIDEVVPGTATASSHTAAPPPFATVTGAPVPGIRDLPGAGAVDAANGWSRVRAGFRIEIPAHPDIDSELRWFASHPAYFERVFARAEPYFHHVVTAVEARGMPLELALLPVIESAFDAFAYSHGRAAGLWQIIPGTGRRLGLKQNWWYDGRRDVVAATGAALDYLEALHAQFDGDWLLATAAYNAGEGNVRKAVRRNARRGQPTDFWHLALPRETRRYVPRLLALAAIVSDPQSHGLALPPVPDRPYFEAVDLDGQIDLALAAELAGIDVDEVYRLNPGFNRWATDPDGPHRLYVPIHAAENLRIGLARLPADERVRWQRYRISSGDTLSTIAQRHGVTAGLLRQVNNLSSTRIRTGDTLMIPSASLPKKSYALSADARLARQLDRHRSRGAATYRVRAGDSLWTIARAHGMSVRKLARDNGMAPGDTLKIGRELVVTRAAAAYAPNARDGTTRRIAYTVRRGDSLWRISSRFRVSVGQLKRWNNLSGDSLLRPGQRLVLYVDVTEQTAGG